MLELSLADGIRLLEARAQIAIWCIWAFIALCGVMALSEIGGATGLIDFKSGATPAEVALVIFVAALAYLGIYVLSVVLIAMWIYRGHANLAAAGLYGLQYSPGWAIGWFAIPFANLFKPFAAMRELHNASFHPNTDYSAGSTARLKLWWASLILGGILTNASVQLVRRAGPEWASTGSWINVGTNGLFIISALALAGIIRETTAAQRGNLEAAASAG